MKRNLYNLFIRIQVLRPYQWVKNLLIFTSLIFSTSLFNSNALTISLAAFCIFCMASSGVYILNDLRDADADKLHPSKRHRAIASGKVTKKSAKVVLVLLVLSAAVFSFLLDKNFFIIIMVYLAINIAYSYGLKKVVILDAFIVATGFLLRAFAGCIVIHVIVTPWLFICTLSLALIVSFGKRRNELNVLNIDAKNHRETLQFYNVQLLDTILTICSATAIGTYSLYTMAEDTITRFGSQKLIMTTPFVMYGIFRYLYLIYVQNGGGDPTKLLVKDKPTLVNGALWVACVVYVIYGSKLFPNL